MSDLIERLRARADRHKPEWATASDYWYDNSGKQDRDDAVLLRAAATRIEKLERQLTSTEGSLDAATWDIADLVEVARRMRDGWDLFDDGNWYQRRRRRDPEGSTPGEQIAYALVTKDRS